MSRATRSFVSATERGGALLVVVLCAAALLVGLAVAASQQSRGALVDVERTEGLVRALEIAEAGIARAEGEILSGTDPVGDGVGHVSGAFAGGTYGVTATSNGNEWTIVSTGRTAKGVRRIEQGCRLVRRSPFLYAVFARSTVTLSGGSQTDSFDSSVGTYASQATNTDAGGPYALARGSIGTNAGDIKLRGGPIRGDVTPGPLHVVDSLATVITGSSASLSQPVDFPSTPQAEFTAAYARNGNETWTITGGVSTYTAASRSLSVSGGVVTLPPGTYFFSELSLTSGATLNITGPTKIYVTGRYDSSGGGVQNSTGDPSNLIVYGHPYPVPGVATPSVTAMSFTGGSQAYLCVYGPLVDLTVSGNSDVFGSLMAGNVRVTGGAFVHYDQNLSTGAGRPRLEETYWAERTPPLR